MPLEFLRGAPRKMYGDQGKSFEILRDTLATCMDIYGIHRNSKGCRLQNVLKTLESIETLRVTPREINDQGIQIKRNPLESAKCMEIDRNH